MHRYFALLLLPAMAATHSTDTDMTMGTTEGVTMMVPYLHFTPGDAILFQEWVPKDPGPFVGACIGLFLLGALDRWLAAMRRLMEAWWKQRTDVMLSKRFIQLDRSASSQEKGSTDDGTADRVIRENPALRPKMPALSLRNAAPFVPAHDFARGAIMIFQTAITYALMLTAMTFNAGLIISILLGLGAGEVAFGRFAYVTGHTH